MKSVLIGLGALIVFFAAVSPAHAQWYFQIVDAAGAIGYGAQIAVTSDGTPYILYARSPGYYAVFLAWPVKPGGFWDRVQVTSSGGYCAWTSGLELICDLNDNLHFAYLNPYPVYAIFSSETKGWVLPPEAVTSECGILDLAIAENGGTITPAIAYCSTNGLLRVATRNPISGIWSVETVYTGVSYTVPSPSIIADTTGHFHVSFYDVSGRNLMYATNAPDGVWGSQVVDVAGDVGGYSSIVIDSDGYPCIAYYDATNGDLKYAKMVAH